MLNTKLGFFCVHSFAHLMNEVTKSYTKLTAVFSHVFLLGRVNTMICLATIGKQTAVLVSARELACISQNQVS